ncbi:hypothetical protein N7532_011940 [Penicillium argentinense]|uniref:FAD-binding domain-containing protein n=1 Tax=Penicillium argentinense TaxID=1131581 RepID=A0A9W9EJF6_9EURO|nr:uncharacterized protein N7532_011940 [Penicillium argentinense]KAJ5082897.1 hypothetical protein N7532_011940 [Penicillium argentinense]
MALDEDGIRLLQVVGLYSSVYTEIGTCKSAAARYFREEESRLGNKLTKAQFIGVIGGTEPVLDKPAFVEMDYGTTEGGTGHIGFICHKQPALEKGLRDRMAALKACELRSGCEFVCTTTHKGSRKDSSCFFVGADWKTGFTRKQYLEPKGIIMEQAHQAFYEEVWVALNWQIDLPSEKTQLGYTPEQVYDLFFPIDFRFICNPRRPAVCGRFGLPSDRLWRFEFFVMKDEGGDEMSKPEKIKEVVFPYIRHAGSQYDLSQDVAFPEDCIKVLRSRPFKFSARSCNRWSDGRVILCGDAAHIFPPFGGQGIASGFRDAVSIAWRLVILCNNQSLVKTVHERVLKAWYKERKQQPEKSLASTIENGRFVTEKIR